MHIPLVFSFYRNYVISLWIINPSLSRIYAIVFVTSLELY